MAGFEFNSDEQGRALVNVGNTLVDLANIVFRVHDQTGNVVLTTANITEHTNLYFSNTRARNAFTAGSGITIAANGLISANVGSLDLSNANIVIMAGVDSVNGANGNVILTTSNIAEGANLYFTNSRARTAISITGSGTYNNTTGVITITAGSGDVVSVNGANGNVVLTTANLAESGNLYFTNDRVWSNVVASITTSYVPEGANLYFTNARVYAAVTGNLALKANVTDLTTSNVSEGANLYFTNARVAAFVTPNLDLKANVTDLTTANVTELNNLYFTNARVSAYLSNISGNLIPDSDNVYDLGSASNRWRDLYLTGNSLYLGNITIKDSGSGVRFLSSSTGTSLPIEANTSSLVESSNNLFFTNARARAALTVTGNGTYNNTTGVITVTGINIAGSNGQIQYNSAGNLAASANLVWDNANVRLGIGNASPNFSLDIVSDVVTVGEVHLASFRPVTRGDGAVSIGYVADGTTDTYGFIRSRHSVDLGIGAGTTTHLFIKQSGNTGIGTTIPSQRLEVSGTGLATTDWRAPTFYDSNNTAYYVDPSSTGTSGVFAGQLVVGDGIRAATSNYITPYNLFALSDTYDSGTYYGIKYVEGSPDTIQIIGANTIGLSIGMDVGDTTASSSLRAPIFYDSNNTSYYADPASTSRLNAISINSIVGNTTNYSVYNSSNTLLATPTGINYSSAFMHFTGANSIAPYSMYRTGGDWPVPYGIGFSTGGESSGIFQQFASNGSSLGPMVFYTGNDGLGSFSWKRHTWESTTYQGVGSGHLATGLMDLDWNQNLYVYGSARAPIFYDYNDTAYYINPNSGSNTWGLQTNNGGHSDSRWCQRYTHSSSDGNAQILIWCSEPGITYDCAGIGSNIYTSGQYYGRDNSANPYGVYLRFDINNGYSEFWSTTGTPGTNGGQGSRNWYVDSAGNSVSSGNVTAYSDIRLKTNIQVITGALEKISKIRGVTYDRTDTQNPLTQVGVIAQEVEKVLPEAVSEDEKGIKTVAYGNMVGLLIEAIKEQQQQIQNLKDALLVKP